jgi:hypothetical protein
MVGVLAAVVVGVVWASQKADPVGGATVSGVVVAVVGVAVGVGSAHVVVEGLG